MEAQAGTPVHVRRQQDAVPVQRPDFVQRVVDAQRNRVAPRASAGSVPATSRSPFRPGARPLRFTGSAPTSSTKSVPRNSGTVRIALILREQATGQGSAPAMASVLVIYGDGQDRNPSIVPFPSRRVAQHAMDDRQASSVPCPEHDVASSARESRKSLDSVQLRVHVGKGGVRSVRGLRRDPPPDIVQAQEFAGFFQGEILCSDAMRNAAAATPSSP